jgi:hypothetical protein
MKVTQTKMAVATQSHPLQQIANGALTPIAKADLSRDKRIATAADISAGNTLANEVAARAMSDAGSWRSLAGRAVALSFEGRAQFLTALDAQLKGWRAAAKQPEGEYGVQVDKKEANRRVASATVMCSQIRTVAFAWNAGASEADCLNYIKGKMRSAPAKFTDVSMAMLYEYGQTFRDSKPGRTPDTLLVAFGKWIETRAKMGIADTDAGTYASLVELHNKLVEAQPKAF